MLVSTLNLIHRTDLKMRFRYAGGIWLDQEVVVDHGLVTSRSPKDLKAFKEKLLEELTEGIHI